MCIKELLAKLVKWAHICHPSCSKAGIGESQIQDQPAQIVRPYLKNCLKKAGNIPQIYICLACARPWLIPPILPPNCVEFKICVKSYETHTFNPTPSPKKSLFPCILCENTLRQN